MSEIARVRPLDIIPGRGVPYRFGNGALVGGGGGQEFDDIASLVDGGTEAEIVSLQVNSGETLDHLVVTYSDPRNLQGDTFSIQHGGSPGGSPWPPFTIDLSQERLVWVELWCHYFDGTYELNGLKFTKIDLTTYGHQDSGVLGQAVGDYSWLNADEEGAICCLFGRQGLFVDALGIYVRPWNQVDSRRIRTMREERERARKETAAT